MTRQQLCQSAAVKLAASTLQSTPCLIGLDGFVDAIIEVVDKRHSATSYDKVPTIADFGKKILNAAGQSSNYEFVITMQKLGGNGPIMANAMASIGFPVTYIGNLGYPAINPVFHEMTQRANVISIAEPGYTDAVEFSDGKLMLGKHQALRDVNWDNLLARVGKDKFSAFCAAARLIGMVNWTMLAHMTNIWEHLLSDVLPTLPAPQGGGGRKLFIDLADPEKRPVDDLRNALQTLTRFQQHLDVILGLNLKESDQVAAALNITTPAHSESAIEDTARAIRDRLNLHTVVIHPRKGAAAANASESASFQGPFVQHPKISTGAGDHFNAGFVTAQLLGLNLPESLAAGTATSGYYVRNAASPTLAQLANFTQNLPDPQP